MIARAAEGDADAYRILYEAHVARIYGLCLRMTADDVQAEEFTQRTFVRAWDRLSSFRGASKFSTWLHTLAVRLILDDRRSTKLRERRRPPFRRPPPSARGADPDGTDLDRAVARLPERARQVLVLHDVEGLKHAEIAEVMGISTGTSKAHLHRARRQLREWLEGR